MRPLSGATLSGTWGTLLLPIDVHEGIDWGRLAADADRLVATDLYGLYAHGTAGEFFTLTEDEHRRVNEILASRCEAAGKPFQIGASHMSAQIGLERIRAAAACAPSAIQVTLPDWLTLTDDEVVRCLLRMAEVALPIPLVLYNPPNSKTLVSSALYGRLRAEVPALIGCKVAGGDADWFAGMRDRAPGLRVFVAGSRLASSVALGAAGSYSDLACLSPDGACAWWDLMHDDLDAALALEGRIRAFWTAHLLPLQRDGYADPALDKFLAHVGGWSQAGTRTRWPYRWVAEDRAAAVRPVARTHLPELFGPPRYEAGAGPTSEQAAPGARRRPRDGRSKGEVTWNGTQVES